MGQRERSTRSKCIPHALRSSPAVQLPLAFTTRRVCTAMYSCATCCICSRPLGFENDAATELPQSWVRLFPLHLGRMSTQALRIVALLGRSYQCSLLRNSLTSSLQLQQQALWSSHSMSYATSASSLRTDPVSTSFSTQVRAYICTPFCSPFSSPHFF